MKNWKIYCNDCAVYLKNGWQPIKHEKWTPLDNGLCRDIACSSCHLAIAALWKPAE